MFFFRCAFVAGVACPAPFAHARSGCPALCAKGFRVERLYLVVVVGHPHPSHLLYLDLCCLFFGFGRILLWKLDNEYAVVHLGVDL